MQKIKVCKKCGAQMDASAKACPQCGAPAKSKKGWIIGGVVLLIIFAAASGGSGGNSSDSRSPSVVSQVTSSAGESVGSSKTELESGAVSGGSSGNSSDSKSPEAVSQVTSSVGESVESSETELESNAVSEEKQAVNNIFHVGDVVDTGKAIVTFKSVEDYTSDNMFIQPEEGNKFIYAYFIIENKDKSDLFTSSYDFSCYADNSVCDSHIVTEKALSSDSISPGRKSEGYICFEVPTNAQTIEIEYEMSWWTQEKAIFIAKE